MNFKICVICDEQVQFWACDVKDPKVAFCWPCWVNRDNQEEE